MEAEPIRTHLSQMPFIPFSVVTSDGRSILIPHPEYAFLTQGGRMLFINLEGDKVHHVYVPMITRIEADSASEAFPSEAESRA